MRGHIVLPRDKFEGNIVDDFAKLPTEWEEDAVASIAELYQVLTDARDALDSVWIYALFVYHH